TAFVKLPVMTAVEMAPGSARRSSAYWQAIADTAIITAMPAINPRGSADGRVATLKTRTAASSTNWISSSGRARLGPRRCEAWATSQTTARADMKTGMASACATLNGPPSTAAAAATTRLPVMWAVKTCPRVKKPVRSTIPAMTLSNGGRRASRCDGAAAPSAGSPWSRNGVELLASDDMFSRSCRFCLRRTVAEIVDDQLGNDQAQAHRQDDDRGRHSGGDRRLYQRQCRRRPIGDLLEPAHHPEQVDARHHRHHGRKADGRKRHVRASRDRGEDQADDDAGDQRAGRDAETEHGERDPPQHVGQRTYRHRPRQHPQRRREEDAVAGNRDPGGDHVLP